MGGELTGAVDEGLLAAEMAQAQTPEEGRAYREEVAAVKRALGEIEQAQNFDKDYLTQIGIDRAYARGDSRHEVRVNLIGSALDTMTAFLYSRDPDVSIVPAPQTEQPKIPAPALDPNVQRGMADPAVMADPQMRQLTEEKLAEHQQAMQAWQQDMAQRKAVRDRAKRFCETLEIVVSQAWRVAKLKRAMRKCVRSSLTTSLGWIKCTWQERRGMDPVTMQAIADLQDNIRRLASTKAGMTDSLDSDADMQYLREQMLGLQAKVEVVISRGMAIDMVSPDDITLPIGLVNALDYLDSPWIDHKTYMTVDDAMARYAGADEDLRRKIATATRYSQRRPMSTITGEPQQYARALGDGETTINPSQFTRGGDGGMAGNETLSIAGAGDFVCVHERWVRDTNLIKTMIEGVACYVVPPHAPDVATSRFYPFFALAFTEVDGTRYPQSKTYRTAGLQDEYNGRRTAWKQIRSRNKQGILANAAAVETNEAGKVNIMEDGEWAYVKMRPDTPMSNAFIAKPTTPPIPELYQTDPILRDFEREWGLQEAIQGSVDTKKTATEAEIQQQGFGTRTNFMRDYVDDVLNDMAVYSCEILVQTLKPEDVTAIAGPGAVWPPGLTVDDLASLVTVQIRAGSTGKPNTSREREAWAATLPMLQNLVMQVGQARGATPGDIADKLEMLGEITLQRSGDSLDIEALMPQPGDGAGAPMGGPQQGQPMDGQQGQPMMGQPGMPQDQTQGEQYV